MQKFVASDPISTIYILLDIGLHWTFNFVYEHSEI